jgi:hypothetical protein
MARARRIPGWQHPMPLAAIWEDVPMLKKLAAVIAILPLLVWQMVPPVMWLEFGVARSPVT